MKLLFWLAIVIVAVAFICEIIRITRIVIANIKGDQTTVDRLTMTVSDCKNIAVKLGYSEEEFSDLYQTELHNNPETLPWDIVELIQKGKGGIGHE